MGRRRLSRKRIGIAIAVAVVLFAISPALQGYHIGYSRVDTNCVTRLAIQFCKNEHGRIGREQAATEVREKAEREQREKEERDKGVTKYAGLNSHGNLPSVSTEEVDREFKEAHELGVNVERYDIYWNAFEPTQGAITETEGVKRIDLLVNEAARYGIKVTGTITETPPWASTAGHGDDAPTTPSVEKPFAKRLLERTTPAGTKYSSVFVALANYNEPNLNNNLKKPNDNPFSSTADLATKYTAMTNAIYEGAKEANPAIKVLLGETGVCQSCKITFPSKDFLDDVLSDGVKFTGLGLHAYCGLGLHAYCEGVAPEAGINCAGYPETGENAIGSTKCKVEKAHTILSNHGYGSKPIWVNEWGFTNNKTEAVRAEYVKKTIELLDNTTKLPYVEGWNYYQLHDPAGSGEEENYGLLKFDFEPRLSFTAFKAALYRSKGM